MSLQIQAVSLPDGTVVTISSIQELWWTDPEGSGYLSPNTLAPDIDQPRRYMGKARLDELKESVEARGVRESITITPRHLAPWIRVEPENENCFFAIVSGHRRRYAALSAKVSAVPVKIRVYMHEKDHRLDASLLNSGQDELAPLEEGIEMVRLNGLGWSITQLTKAFGWSGGVVQSRMNLTKLAPDIQQLLDPELPAKKRLSSQMAGVLGGLTAPSYEELYTIYSDLWVLYKDQSRVVMPSESLEENERRFALQRLLLEFAVQRNMAAARAINFFKDKTFNQHKHNHRRGLDPGQGRVRRGKRREMIERLMNTVNGSPIIDWPPQEIRRVFDLTSYEEIEEYITQLRDASDILQGIARVLVRLKAEKKPTTMEGRRLKGANGVDNELGVS
jgi:hypothetical protein